MKYFSKLSGIFVKSAVQQVGRDGGKVISNKIYGNAHSIPIRQINNLNNNSQTDFKELKLYNTKDSWFTPTGLIICFVFCIIPFINFIGVIIGVYHGFKYLLAKNKKMIKLDMQSIQVPDKRYKDGYRTEKQTVLKDFKVKIQDDEKRKYLIYGVLYFIIGIGVTFISFKTRS